MSPREYSFEATERNGEVGGLWLRPRGAELLYVFAHGAGAGMTHRFMEAMAVRLAEHRIATFRFQFPYIEAGRRRPDPPPVIEATVRSAVRFARRIDRKLPLIAGGKSMGGRLTSVAQAREPMEGVRGLAFTGFPLHGPGKPSDQRAAHLGDIRVPMLFLQGTRDTLAELEWIRPVCRKLGSGTSLHIVDGADHGFHVLKRSGRTEGEVLDELADEIQRWSGSLQS